MTSSKIIYKNKQSINFQNKLEIFEIHEISYYIKTSM